MLHVKTCWCDHPIACERMSPAVCAHMWKNVTCRVHTCCVWECVCCFPILSHLESLAELSLGGSACHEAPWVGAHSRPALPTGCRIPMWPWLRSETREACRGLWRECSFEPTCSLWGFVELYPCSLGHMSNRCFVSGCFFLNIHLQQDLISFLPKNTCLLNSLSFTKTPYLS